MSSTPPFSNEPRTARSARQPANGAAGSTQAAAPTATGAAPLPRSSTAMNALVHLYRADVGKMTAYRQRLDTTTNWGITTSALVTTFALTNQSISPAAFLFLMLVNGFFLTVEARRYRAYEAARYRVMMLERWFFPEVLGGAPDEEWVNALIRALKTPTHTVSSWGAVGWRLRRNYLWIYLAVLLVWVVRLELGRPTGLSFGESLLRRADIGDIPGALVWGVVAVMYLGLIVLAILAKRTYPLGVETASMSLLRLEPD